MHEEELYAKLAGVVSHARELRLRCFFREGAHARLKDGARVAVPAEGFGRGPRWRCGLTLALFALALLALALFALAFFA